MIVVSFCNHKGGTGKTTSVIHFAAALGLSGRRVLVIDLDPQGFLTRALGVKEPAVQASSLILFDPHASLGEMEVLPLKGFDLIPSSGALTKLMRRLNKPTDVLWAKEAIEQLAGYDVVLIDTAAAVTVFSLNAIVASRLVVIPVTPEYQPVLGAEQTFQTASMVKDKLNPTLKQPLFLFTRVDGRKRDHYRYRHYLRKRYSEHVMQSVIRTSTSLATAYDDGTTVFENDPYSRGARDYANATDELIRHLTPATMREPASVVGDGGLPDAPASVQPSRP